MKSEPNKYDPDTPEGRLEAEERIDRYAGKHIEDVNFFMMKPGRYYFAMWHMKMPEWASPFKKGGNLVFLAWRKHDEPTKWWLRFRFRYYKVESAWTGEDKFSWHTFCLPAANDEVALEVIGNAIRKITEHSAQTLDTLMIKGDSDKFFEALEREKPYWMQTKGFVSERHQRAE